MAEYIEREAAIGGLDELERTSYHNSVLWPDHVEECRETLRSIPAADVRPVVPCCDCKHFQVNVSPSGYLPQGVPEWECRHWLRPTDPTDFCSWGEKREES